MLQRREREVAFKQAVIDKLPEGAEELLRTLDRADRIRRSTAPVHLEGELLVRWLRARVKASVLLGLNASVGGDGGARGSYNSAVLIGPDGRANEGPTSGAASQLGLHIARERGWQAPSVPLPEQHDDEQQEQA